MIVLQEASEQVFTATAWPEKLRISASNGAVTPPPPPYSLKADLQPSNSGAVKKCTQSQACYLLALAIEGCYCSILSPGLYK